ncbi:MAG: hypothetical protein ACSLE0_11170 [Chitinophagaceae bacterium]
MIYTTFLLLPVFQACVSKTASKTSVQKEQTIQNLTSDPSMSAENDSLAGASIRNDLVDRKLVKRGPVWQLTHESGKAVVKICVDQTGKVISANFDYGESSRNFARFAWKAESIARQYVFEQNVTAPPEECGQLAFVFKRN